MNTFGRIFRVSIFGESHGPAIGVVIDGVEPGLPLSEEDFMADIRRRKSGAPGTTPRIEEDRPEIVSGVFEGHTTGAPLTVLQRCQCDRALGAGRYAMPAPDASPVPIDGLLLDYLRSVGSQIL